MGIAIKNLPDGHYAKTAEAITASVVAEKKECVLQLDTGYTCDPFHNGSAYVLFGPIEEDGNRQALGEGATGLEAIASLKS